jgi:hypothetical protein
LFAVVQAITKFTANRVCVLRCLWALEHVCSVPDNYQVFETEGGKGVLQTLEAVYRRDRDISDAIKHMKTPPKTGRTSNCLIQ